ncbi:MAG: tRNA lysidine(34) synthetase TilS, partial [Rhodospirillales bacterium]|nr:tRNA lysidine(34) synthetase TilS [Rhodospirillales bacterium]
MSAPIHSLDGVFAQAMAALGPFETRPHLAVAVSGGADSLALALLADPWAKARGGRVTALTLDHGLRASSAEEARRVGAWLGHRGIAHRILEWPGAKPRSAIQARARAARYAILGAWCRAAGVLHLLVAHQREDQAETLLLRLAGGSGPDGLAGMSALVEMPEVRILRPLLGVSRCDLETFLRDSGQEWIEDSSNRDPRFARTRVREGLPALAAQGVTVESLAAAARRFADVRVALEAATAALLARGVRVHPAGFAVLALSEFRAAPAEIAARALARALAAVGGRAYPPALDKAARILAQAAARP